MDYHRSKGSLPGWQSGGGGMQGGADAQLSRRSMQLHANPSNGRRLHSLPLCLSLSLSSSLHAPLLFLLFFSRAPTDSLSLSLPLSPHPSCYPSVLTAPSVNDLRAR